MILYNAKQGFTLIEMLIVLIIIAVLAAVAVPQYKHAVLKSRFSTVMPIAKAVADAQEVYYLGRNYYANNSEKDVLDVATGTDAMLELATQGQENEYNYVAASHPNVLGARYIMYQAHSPKFAGNIHCEADETNADALWLCKKGLNGTEIPGSINQSAGEYRTFLLSGNTGEDKLPTSFAKQVEACEESASCTVVQQGLNTTLTECEGSLTGTSIKTCTSITYGENGERLAYEKTEQQCGQTVDHYPTMSYPNYSLRSEKATNGCITRTYDEAGNQTDFEGMFCSGKSGDGGECGFGPYSTNTFTASKGLLYTDEAGWTTKVQSFTCLKKNNTDNTICDEYDVSKSYVTKYVPDGNGHYYQWSTLYCATINTDGTCATYDTERSSFSDYETDSWSTCANFNADGSCISYSARYRGLYYRRQDSEHLLCSSEEGNIDVNTGYCL